jgi:AraC family transcriptional regulator, transcriptional activator of pobA
LRREPQVTGFVLSFSREFFFSDSSDTGLIDSLPFFDNPGVQPLLSVAGTALSGEIDQLLLKIQDEYASGREDSGDMLRSYLTALLIHARRIYIPHTEVGTSQLQRSELTRRFKKLVEEHFRQHKTVAAYAGMLNITAGHLSDTIQKDTGRTASEIIQQRVILEAKRLLFHSSKSVKEIAFELQYEDPSYFSRFFKTHAALTPEQFRSHIREKYH